MHLVRNSVSHGIESEEERSDRGKPKDGQINIHACSKRGYVYVEIEDDGRGLDLALIRTKAIAGNLIDPNLNYSPEEMMKIIFLPGFSTRETVDNISGRGVGMNVVETEIKKVGGKIDIFNKPGEGCKFVIKIPLNLAVMNGTIVDIFGDRYIIPTLYIKQFIKPNDSQWLKVKDRKTMVRVRDEVIQIIPPDKILGVETIKPIEDENMVVIIEVERRFKALPVRRVIGRQEIVAKPMGKEFSGLDYAAGATILGDGRVALILDVEAIFKINDSQCH
jgi:two-component system chemotaxis sensor kinase CheA